MPIGTVLGGAYRLTRLLAEGGMGAVYEARHLRLDRRCAVKLLTGELANDGEALARFSREVKITSQLAHPHIVHIADCGTTDDGQPYLVMEYLDGEDLERRLRRVGRVGLRATLAIVKQIASALAATHAKGIVHRDLKPANVFLLDLEGEPDFVKVVDFGISKQRHAADQLTRASIVMGTPDYMAPEQATARVKEIDHRTDQWALACIAWEMLSGRRPFVAEDVTALLYKVVHGDAPPLVAPAVPADVEAVLRRALAKRQGDRFPTVAAFVRALDAAAVAPVAAPAPVRVATPPPQRRPLVPAFAAWWPPRARPRRTPVLGTMLAAPRALWGSLLPRKKPRWQSGRQSGRNVRWIIAAACVPVVAAVVLAIAWP